MLTGGNRSGYSPQWRMACSPPNSHGKPALHSDNVFSMIQEPVRVTRKTPLFQCGLRSHRLDARGTDRATQGDKRCQDYLSAKHRQHWIAYVDGLGWTMFPAEENGWTCRPQARGVDPMLLREVPLHLASGTGFPEAVESHGCSGRRVVVPRPAAAAFNVLCHTGSHER
jgi:hypothetical protein